MFVFFLSIAYLAAQKHENAKRFLDFSIQNFIVNFKKREFETRKKVSSCSLIQPNDLMQHNSSLLSTGYFLIPPLKVEILLNMKKIILKFGPAIIK